MVLSRSGLKSLAGILLPMVLCAALLPCVGAFDNDDCFTCHDDAALIKTNAAGKRLSLRVDGKAFAASVHGTNKCTSCHADITDLPHAEELKPVECATCHGMQSAAYTKSGHGIARAKGITEAPNCSACHGTHDIHKPSNPDSSLHWQKLAATCGRCHYGIQRSYVRSVHGKAMSEGNRHAPVCTDCHGEHNVSAPSDSHSSVNAAHIPETCGRCHAAERIVTRYRLPENPVGSYMQSYHGLSMQLGVTKVANCASCHTAHDILPSSDPLSSVHPSRLPETCGRCHPGIGVQVATARIHSEPDGAAEHISVTYARWFYYLLIAGVLGGMFVHNFLDFARKFQDHVRRQRLAGGAVRMSVADRLQHVVLVVTFFTLAYTGFALKFPNAWWARPCVGAVDIRGAMHRVAAAAFILLVLWHSAYMFFTSRGRRHLRALCPRWSDVEDAIGMFLYYLHIRRDKPKMGFYNYTEKAEYWALVWGTIIMVATGVLMACDVWTLRTFPKWVYDLSTAIHYYEAILATAAIAIWHMYFIIFDPDEYPMKMTMVSGLESEADTHHRSEH